MSSANSPIIQFFHATRSRTYPIAIMSLGVGQDLAYRTLGGFGVDNWVLCVLIIYTALSLQILSNLANDLGDAFMVLTKTVIMTAQPALSAVGRCRQAGFGRGLSFGLSKP